MRAAVAKTFVRRVAGCFAVQRCGRAISTGVTQRKFRAPTNARPWSIQTRFASGGYSLDDIGSKDWRARGDLQPAPRKLSEVVKLPLLKLEDAATVSVHCLLSKRSQKFLRRHNILCSLHSRFEKFGLITMLATKRKTSLQLRNQLWPQLWKTVNTTSSAPAPQLAHFLFFRFDEKVATSCSWHSGKTTFACSHFWKNTNRIHMEQSHGLP